MFHGILPETRLFGFKRSFLRCSGITIGKDTRIASSAKIIGSGKLIIGSNTWIGLNTMIVTSGEASIIIGDNVDLAPQVFIGTGTHEINTDGTRMAGAGVDKNITIGSGSWIGARAVILPGVNIGKMCIVAAGAVVNKDVESYSLVAGVPAKVKKNLNRVGK